MSKCSIHEAKTKEELDLFWEKRDRYMLEDVLPNSTKGKPITQEDYDWFFSQEYKDMIMDRYTREKDKLYIVFYEKDKVDIGFAVYVTFHSEDGKCFIVDFCIDKEFRNQGLGKECFQLIESKELEKGAVYFALNLSNKDNERFWMSQGFVKTDVDEYGSYVYIYKPKGHK